ncbi:tetraspanin-36-like [Pelobates fuscus]|uniref:tetraspanin-36-like n=1 Tax=Pelobates fuscus TaxID=191477 RepID=UPI002FE4703D
MGLGVITSKTFLCLLSLIYLASASGLFYVALKVILTYRQYAEFLGNYYVTLPAVVILFIAVIMLIIGFFGCFAIVQESSFGLGCFMFLTSIIFAAGITGLVLGLIYKDKIDPELDENMNKLFQEYDGKSPQSSPVDFMQEQLQCCGVKNYTFWHNSTWQIASKNNSVPYSCCRKNATNCTGNLTNMEKINTAGCEDILETLVHKVLEYSLYVILGFAVLEFFGLISICVITCRGSRNGYQLL